MFFCPSLSLQTSTSPYYFPFSAAFAYHPPSSPKFHFHTRAPSVHTLYICPFTLKEAPLAVSNILSSINFPQPHLTLALEDSSAPPPFPIHNLNIRIFQQPPPSHHSPTQTALSHQPPSPHQQDRKSTRLNSSHPSISYAVF